MHTHEVNVKICVGMRESTFRVVGTSGKRGNGMEEGTQRSSIYM